MASNGPSGGQHTAHDSALSVSSTDDGSAAAKVKELEAEVAHLSERAAASSHRFADYENQLRVLQAQLRQEQRKDASGRLATSQPVTPSSPPPKPGLARFGSFMYNRKPLPDTPTEVVIGHPTLRERELEESLSQEKNMRTAAEKKVREVNAELEELSASLFEQANEMVASERKESAKLRDRVRALEQLANSDSEATQKENAKLREKLRTLEQRDTERRRRLDRLEAANKRIERVKAMLLPR